MGFENMLDPDANALRREAIDQIKRLLLAMPPGSDLAEPQTALRFLRRLADVSPNSVYVIMAVLNDLLPDLKPEILAALGEQAVGLQLAFKPGARLH